MKIACPMFTSLIEIKEGDVFSLVIENPKLFREFIEDLNSQLSGNDGKTVLSKNNTPIPIKKNMELIDRFAPFDINTKTLLSAVNSVIEKNALTSDNYLKTSGLLQNIEQYLFELCFDLPFRAECNNLNISSIIKAAQIRISDDYNTAIEAIIDYMNLVLDLVGQKLFVFINLRSYFSDSEIESFAKTVKLKQMRVLLIESVNREIITDSKRLIIDSDLCEI